MRHPLSLATGSFPVCAPLGSGDLRTYSCVSHCYLEALGRNHYPLRLLLSSPVKWEHASAPSTSLDYSGQIFEWVYSYLYIINLVAMAAKRQLLFAIFRTPLVFPCLCVTHLSGIPFHLLHLPKSDPPLKAHFKPHFLHVIIHYASSWKPSHPSQDPLFFALLIYFLAIFCFIF